MECFIDELWDAFRDRVLGVLRAGELIDKGLSAGARSLSNMTTSILGTQRWNLGTCAFTFPR